MIQKEAYSYQKMVSKTGRKVTTSDVRFKDVVQALFIWIFCFIMGRASIFQEIAPFGVALFATVFSRRKNTVAYLVAVGLGLLSCGLDGFPLKYILAMVIIFLYTRIPAVAHREWSDLHMALTVFVSLVLTNSLYICIHGLLTYDLILAGMESFIGFIMALMFRRVMNIFLSQGKRRILSNEEMICISVFLALLLIGLGEINLLGVSIRNIFSIALVLVFAYVGGAGIGASMGIIIGLFLSMATLPNPILIGSFGVCGLIAGTFKDLGRIGTSGAFILANALMTFYINRSIEVILPFEEIAVAGAILLFIPRRAMEYLKQFLDFSTLRYKEHSQYINRMKELIATRLGEFSQVFHRLAQVFSQISQHKILTGKDSITKLFDLVAQQVCSECALYRGCWQRDFHRTYNNMFELISLAETKGVIDREQIPNELTKGCLKLEQVVDVINEACDLYRANYRWQQKIDECRNLVSQQLEGVSHVVTQLAKELDMDMPFKKDLEDKLLLELDKKGIRVKEVLVIEKPNRKLEVNIIKKSCGGRRECIQYVEKIVGAILGKPMSCKSQKCGFRTKDQCILQLTQSQKFQIITGVSRKTKQYTEICGDSYTFTPIDQGKYMLALSDGMGSGSRAADESNAVISLLENFLEAGFDLDITIRTINSILMLRSREEMFATADLCIVDLVTANADFIKIGAVSTFIKRRDYVEVIRTPALPMGILEEIHAETVTITLEDGDMIVMLTDGVLDNIDSELDRDQWMANTISQLDTHNPQELVDYIMEETLKQSGGEIKDDMTVMVSRVWRPYFANPSFYS